jgi:hypothetical protein
MYDLIKKKFQLQYEGGDGVPITFVELDGTPVFVNQEGIVVSNFCSNSVRNFVRTFAIKFGRRLLEQLFL